MQWLSSLLARPLLLAYSCVMRLARAPIIANLRTIVRMRSLVPIRIAWLAACGRVSGGALEHDIEIAHGIDCSCYYTENFYVTRPVEGHFEFISADVFRKENSEMMDELGTSLGNMLVSELEVEAERRRDAVAQAVARKQRIAIEYRRKHNDLWTLTEHWLHPEFIALVDAARVAAKQGRPLDESFTPPLISEGVYAVKVFSESFCMLLCDELDNFSASGLPAGRPNSMNTAGVLMDELGFTPQLLEPLLRDYVRPLASALTPLAERGGESLDHQKTFVVKYQLGEVRTAILAEPLEKSDGHMPCVLRMKSSPLITTTQR